MQSLQTLCRWDRPIYFKFGSVQAAAWILDICGLEQKEVWEGSLQTTETASLWISLAEV